MCYRDTEDRSNMSEDDKRRSTESLPAKPFALAPLTDEEKSASQPNIAALPSSQVPQRPPRLSTTSTDSGKSNATGSTSSSGGSSDSPTGSLHSLTSKDSAYSMSSKETLDDLDEEDEEDECIAQESESSCQLKVIDTAKITPAPTTTIVMKTTEDLANDIDTALAEVMSGLQSLEMQQNMDKPTKTTTATMNVAAKHTPDLVLDLPVSDEPPSPKERVSPVSSSGEKSSGGATSSSGSDTESPTLSTAEVFAKSNQSTIKKGQTITMLRGSGATRVAELSQMSSAPIMRRTGGDVNTRLSPAKTALPSPSPPMRKKDEAKESSSENIAVEQVWQPQHAQILRTTGDKTARPVTPERSHSQYERSVTPEKPLLAAKPNTLPRPSPDRGPKPAPPPLRAKPAVHKKPGKSPEVLQKLREGTLGSMDSSSNASNA